MIAFEETLRHGGREALAELGRFFMGEGMVNVTLDKISRRLADIQVRYAIVGGMAVYRFGYERSTSDVDLLVSAEGLRTIHEQLEGLGYVPPFAGSKQLRDTETNVKIEFLVTGGYPGDGKPKPVSFPDPASCADEFEGKFYINLEKLIELKLASGMSNINRLKDLADVVELIKVRNLDESFADKLNPYVRDKYLELCIGVKNAPNPFDE